MSRSEKMAYSAKRLIQPFDYLQWGFGSGIAHWRDAPHEWGQGWDAFGVRYTSRIGQHLSKKVVMLGVQALAGEDPRRIPSKQTRWWPRAKDAIKYTFITQRDDGTRGFAYGRIIANYGGGMISRAWHPDRLHTVRSGLAAGSTSLGIEVGTAVFNEFLPDILRRVRRR